MLADLEKSALPGRAAAPSPSRRAAPAAADLQMPLFQPEQPLTAAVLALDIPNLTPLEAINKLYELQEQARSGG